MKYLLINSGYGRYTSIMRLQHKMSFWRVWWIGGFCDNCVTFCCSKILKCDRFLFVSMSYLLLSKNWLKRLKKLWFNVTEFGVLKSTRCRHLLCCAFNLTVIWVGVVLPSFLCCFSLKGYLCYKTITITHQRHILRIVLFRRKIMFRSQYFQVFVFLTFSWFTESVTSRWVLVHESRYIF